jgi:Sulfatase
LAWSNPRLVLTLPVFVGGAVRPTASGAVLQSVRPNILIILTDDQSTDELSAMPRTTAWFQEGSTVFDRGYVTTPLRCPSRSTIFSGRYIHNHGNTQNDHPFNLDQSATFQRYLQDAGYTTALTASSSPNGRTTNAPHFDRFTITSGGYYGLYVRSNDGGLQEPGWLLDDLPDAEGARGHRRLWRSIRTKAYQYIETYDKSGNVAFREYRPRKDPWQNQNLLADGNSANDPDVAALRAKIARYAKCVGALCP